MPQPVTKDFQRDRGVGNNVNKCPSTKSSPFDWVWGNRDATAVLQDVNGD